MAKKIKMPLNKEEIKMINKMLDAYIVLMEKGMEHKTIMTILFGIGINPYASKKGKPKYLKKGKK